MKLVTFETAGRSAGPGILTERGVVDIASAVKPSYTAQLTMQGVIDDFDHLRPTLEKLARDADALPLEKVRLRAPLPRPGKILACIANYWEHA
ncbi:MAG: 5-carboxymethyl-2-hydroxymuconate isomerase, partial [Xanthobacteraceae bacterium]